MFSVQNMEELRLLYESDTPVPAYDFKRRTVEGWTPEHSHHRGQLVALTHGLLIVETGNERGMFPVQRCAWGGINWRRCHGSEIGKQKSGTPKFALDIDR
jgi:hypothetical protein